MDHPILKEFSLISNKSSLFSDARKHYNRKTRKNRKSPKPKVFPTNKTNHHHIAQFLELNKELTAVCLL